MEEKIQEININIAEMNMTLKYMNEKIDKIPDCKRELVEEKIKTVDGKAKVNRWLIWFVYVMLSGATTGLILKTSIASMLK